MKNTQVMKLLKKLHDVAQEAIQHHEQTLSLVDGAALLPKERVRVKNVTSESIKFLQARMNEAKYTMNQPKLRVDKATIISINGHIREIQKYCDTQKGFNEELRSKTI